MAACEHQGLRSHTYVAPLTCSCACPFCRADVVLPLPPPQVQFHITFKEITDQVVWFGRHTAPPLSELCRHVVTTFGSHDSTSQRDLRISLVMSILHTRPVASSVARLIESEWQRHVQNLAWAAGPGNAISIVVEDEDELWRKQSSLVQMLLIVAVLLLLLVVVIAYVSNDHDQYAGY